MNCHSLIPNDSFQTFLHLLLFHFFCCFCSSCTSICCSMGKQSGSSAGKQKLLLSKHSKLLEMRDSVSQGKDFPLWMFPKEPDLQHRDSSHSFQTQQEISIFASQKYPLNLNMNLPDPQFCWEIWGLESTWRIGLFSLSSFL